jgi:outer membrane protein insertion porin family
MPQKLIIFLLLFFLPLGAVTIKEVKFEGMVHISKAVATHMLPFKVGQQFSEQQIDAAIKKFFKQGYFTDIYVTEENGVVTFHFTEKPTISKVEMKGWSTGEEKDDALLLQLKKGSLYDTRKVEGAKERIIDALNMEGKIDSVVEVETEFLDGGSVALTFIVNEGENIIIEELEYSGLSGIDSDEFEDTIANKEREFMGWLWGRNDGKMKVKELEYDPLRIRDVYMQHGYLDAKINEPFVRVDFDHYSSQMSYQIYEGVVYKVKSISFTQDKTVIEEGKIRDVVTLELNEPFNIQTFRNDSSKIKTLVADLGYAYVRVMPDLKKNRDEQTVDVVYRIIPGDKVYIRNVVISGNTRTLDRIIRREIFLGPGELYNATDLKDSKNAMGRTGYFETHTIEEKRIDNKTMDLVVKVKEAPTGNIQIGGGYGSYGGLLASIGISDRNIWGSGINMGLKVEASQLTKSYAYNISNPRLNDSDFSGNFSVYYSDIEYNDYTVETTGTGVGIGHKFTRHVSGYLGYNYSMIDYTDIDENITNDPLYDDRIFESYDKSAMTVSVSYDSTDDYYLPREGIAASQSIELAGPGGDAEFWKSRTTFNAYQGLEEWIGFDLIARYKARYYYVSDEGYLPINERFFMGGLGSVRGYESYSLPTVTVSDPTTGETDELRVGATQTFSNSFELSFPLLPKAKMRLSTFIDWGYIPGESGYYGDTYWTFDDISKGGYGVGIEWFSPVGPVTLIFANPINEEPDDKTSRFEFTIGQRF